MGTPDDEVIEAATQAEVDSDAAEAAGTDAESENAESSAV